MQPATNDVIEVNLSALIRPAIYSSWNTKNKKCIMGYFAPLFLLFTFRSILREGWHSHEKSKDFVVYFFMVLIKYEIRLKCEKCIVSVSHFVTCFTKIFAKYLWNAKYEKCIAGLMLLWLLCTKICNIFSQLFCRICTDFILWIKDTQVTISFIVNENAWLILRCWRM